MDLRLGFRDRRLQPLGHPSKTKHPDYNLLFSKRQFIEYRNNSKSKVRAKGAILKK
jgi:hypothetical protein